MQSADTDKVDAVSGATYSSKGIMAAVRDALKKALAKKDTETTVETNNTNNSTNDNNTNTDNSSEDNTTTVQQHRQIKRIQEVQYVSQMKMEILTHMILL